MYQKMKIDFVLFFNVADNGISYGYRQPYVIVDGDGGDYYGDNNDIIVIIRILYRDNDDIIVIIRILYLLYEN